MIHLTLSGRLGRDAELKETGNGKVINFSVATDVGYGDRKETIWVDCAKWGDKVGILDYLKKGQQVIVTGEPGLRKWDGGAAITCRVDKIELMGNAKEQLPASAPNPGGYTRHAGNVVDETLPMEPIDDLPF